jgi:Tfp pilus assembly protein PilV
MTNHTECSNFVREAFPNDVALGSITSGCRRETPCVTPFGTVSRSLTYEESFIRDKIPACQKTCSAGRPACRSKAAGRQNENIKFQNGFTLLELVIASTLVIFIILAETSVYIGALKMMRQSLWRSFVQNEVNIGMTHMSKMFRQGYSFLVVASDQVRVSVDTAVDPSAIANHTNAITREYRLVGTDLRYTPNISSASYIVLAKGVSEFSVSGSDRTLSITLKCSSNEQDFYQQNKASLRCMAAGSP